VGIPAFYGIGDSLLQLARRASEGFQMTRMRRPIVRHCMNGFVIAVGCYVLPLVKDAKATAKTLGEVQVDVGDTSCKVPNALGYIEKVEAMGRLGKKKKEARC